MQSEILREIKGLNIDCPDCVGLGDDEQYTCTTCWCEGGNGQINVYEWLEKYFNKLATTKPIAQETT